MNPIRFGGPVIVMALWLWATAAQALINPRFTPTQLVKQSGMILVVDVKQGASKDEYLLKVREVLKKGEDGRWLITYEHESWPGCSVPRGPHMGTEGMGEMELEPSVTPTSPGVH